MSIGSQVSLAMRLLVERRFEDAAIAASVAFAATARREHPSLTDKDAFHRFIDESLAVISSIAWVSFGIAQPVRFLYRRLDGRAKEP